MEKLVLTARETAEALKISNEKALRLIHNGEISAYKEGNSWRVPRSLLVKYLEKLAIQETQSRLG